MPSPRQYKRIVIAAAGGSLILAAIVVIGHRTGMRDVARDQPVRIGMQESPPWYFVRTDGRIDGPVYEIMQEAARRAGLKLAWSSHPAGPAQALGKGAVDFWPLMGRLPDRLREFRISEAWLEIPYLLAATVPCEAAASGAGEPVTVAHRDTEVTRHVIRSALPAAVDVIVPSHAEALRALCSGRADAALIAEQSTMTGMLQAPPECAAAKSCLKLSLAGTVGFGIGSRPGATQSNAAAVLLRREIDSMIDDGTLAGILLRWGVSSGEMRALRAARVARSRSNLLAVVAGGLLVLVVALAWILRRLKRVNDAHQRALAELSASQEALRTEFARRHELEERYFHSQKMESLGRLAGAVAHDFNNLLTVINGYSELLLRQQAGSASKEMLDQVLRAGHQAANLTSQLLSFSRRRTARARPLDLNAAVLETRGMLDHVLGAGGGVQCELEPELPLVQADPGQVSQVLMNLAANARDAMPDGGVLTIRTESRVLRPDDARLDGGMSPGPFVSLSVSDTGMGMDEATRARIFEPFFTTKSEGRGTGLGLSTVYGIVQQAGGGIHVRSAPGRGTTFEILLPAIDPKPNGGPHPPPPV